MKKVQKSKAVKSRNLVKAKVIHSTRITTGIFSLILFLIVTPLIFFNLLWFLDVQRVTLSDTFLNLLRLCLLVGFLSYMTYNYSKNQLTANLASGIIVFTLIALASQINRLFSNHPDTNADSVTSHLLLTEAISIGWNPLKPEGESSTLISSSSLLVQSNLSESRIETGIGFSTIQAFYNLLFGVESSYLFVNILFLVLTAVKLLDIFELLGSEKRKKDTFVSWILPIGVICIFLM